jgi:hypothetical protein
MKTGSIYIIRLIRSDFFPDEEYQYSDFDSAQRHYHLSVEDDPSTYMAVQLINQNRQDFPICTRTLLGLSLEEKEIILIFGTYDQFETCLRLTLAATRLADEGLKQSAYSARIKLANISSEKFPHFFSLLRAELNR